MTKENAALKVLEGSLESLRGQVKMEQIEIEVREKSIEKSRDRIAECEAREKEILAAIDVLKGGGR